MTNKHYLITVLSNYFDILSNYGQLNGAAQDRGNYRANFHVASERYAIALALLENNSDIELESDYKLEGLIKKFPMLTNVR